MKAAYILAVALPLFFAAHAARADVFVFPYQDIVLQPAQEESRVQMVPQSRHYYAQPCPCPACGQQQAAMQQPQLPPPPPQPIAAQEERTAYFAFDDARVDAQSKQKLNSLAGRLMSADNVTGTRIIGYADRIGSKSYNEALSRRRAQNVQRYLVNQGLVKPSNIETRWVGKSQPSTNCSKHLPRAQLLRCLAPDRKVEVNVNYRVQPQRMY